jgi:hypothetical protein
MIIFKAQAFPSCMLIYDFQTKTTALIAILNTLIDLFA